MAAARRVSKSPTSGGQVASHRRFGPLSSNRSLRLRVTRPSAVAVTETITGAGCRPGQPDSPRPLALDAAHRLGGGAADDAGVAVIDLDGESGFGDQHGDGLMFMDAAEG